MCAETRWATCSVVDRVNGHRTPLGPVTDRDIVVAVVALDPVPGAALSGERHYRLQNWNGS